MQLLRRALGASVVRDQRGVARLASRERPQAYVLAHLGQQLGGEEFPVAAHAGQHLLDDRRADLLARPAALAVRKAGESFLGGKQHRAGRALPEEVVE